MSQTSVGPEKQTYPVVDFARFLREWAPHSAALIPDFGAQQGAHGPSPTVTRPIVLLFCDDAACEGERFFSSPGEALPMVLTGAQDVFLYYTCRNCSRTVRTFALRYECPGEHARAASGGIAAIVRKIGQWPPFEPHTPGRVLQMVESDRELFLMGRRAEAQRMGMAAFAYYAQIVENQWRGILGAILITAENIGAPPETKEKIKAAVQQAQFSDAAELVKDAIPHELLLDGNNPIAVLRKALSISPREDIDKDRLNRAHAMRVVLTELAERIAEFLRTRKELKESVSRLPGDEGADKKPESRGGKGA